MKTFINAAIFTVLVCLAYIAIAWQITEISGGRKSAATVTGVSAEAGEGVFWGKGKCHTCHSIGGQGSAIRAPNLGVTSDRPLPIALRAAERAKELTEKTGKPHVAADYLVQSHLDPSAYVVEGFKDEMPTVWKPPISLSVEEILAVDLYLLSQGGEADPATLTASPYYAELKSKAGKTGKAEVVEGGMILAAHRYLFLRVQGKVVRRQPDREA